MTLARLLPNPVATPLFGDRKAYGLVPDESDPQWQEWQKEYIRFYQSNQKQGIGKRVNDAGYDVLRHVDWAGKSIVEIGPGLIPHLGMWTEPPARYIAVDISQDFLNATQERLHQAHPDCPFTGVQQTERDSVLPLQDGSADMIVTFYSLEHLYPLDQFLDDYKRVLKPGGLVVGAVPNEGGLAWGLGRFLTSRRWIHKNTTINYDKIICWEHPNFVDTIIRGLDQRFERQYRTQYPLSVPLYDMNLVTRFIYRKEGA